MHTTIVTDMSKTGCLDMFDNIARLINGRIDLELSWIVIGAWLRVHGFFYTCYIYIYPISHYCYSVSVRAPDLFGGHNIWIEDRGVYICISEYLLGPVYTSKSSLFLFARKNISVSLDSWLQGVGKEQDYSSVPFLLLCWARKKIEWMGWTD